MIVTKSDDVRLKVLSPALAWIFYKLELFHRTKICPMPEDLVITSINDGQHAIDSRHYRNEAIDIRSHNFIDEAQKLMFAMHLQDWLGPKFRVLFENKGLPNEHFHVQVKKGMIF